MKNIKNLLINKRCILVTSFVLFISILVVLNISYSIFTNRSIGNIANVKVSGLKYGITINGISNRTITVTGNNTTKANVVLTSLNKWDTKYELIYKVCSDSSCNNFIEKPGDLNIEYSSRTTDSVSDVIVTNGTKQIRIVITNNTGATYYIMLDVNAGFIHNTLALQNLITTEYNEEDVTIAAIINGEISTTFPDTQGNYTTEVVCTTSGAPSNATGTATWNGTKWVVNITGVDTGRTTCNVYFKVLLNNYIIGLANNSETTGVYNENGYRYEGPNPNNYVTFNNELWRIIGIFDSNTHGITGENLVKIIRNDYMRNYPWDSGNVNNWNTSSLKNYLNGEYYNGLNQSSKNLTVSVTWKLGGYSDYATKANMAYTAERGTTVYSGRPTSGTGNIGLMYISDYGYAVRSSSCARTTKLYNYNASGCYNQNWLYIIDYSVWTLTPYSSDSYNVWRVSYYGNVDYGYANYGFVARPVLYLKSNTIKISGEGTNTNPYIIGE